MSFQKLFNKLPFSKSKAEEEQKKQCKPVLSTSSPCPEMDYKKCETKSFELASTKNVEESDKMLPKKNKTPHLLPGGNGSKKRKERSPDTEEADTKIEVKKSFIQHIFGKHSTDHCQDSKALSSCHTSDKKNLCTDSEDHSSFLPENKFLKSLHHRAKSFNFYRSNQKEKTFSLEHSSTQKGHEKAAHTIPGSPDLSVDSSSDSFSVLVCSQEDITFDSNQNFSYSFEEIDAKDEDCDKTLVENIDDSEDDLDHIATLSQSPLLIRDVFRILSTTQKVGTCSPVLNINNTGEKGGSLLQPKSIEEPSENCKQIIQVPPSTPNIHQQLNSELDLIQYHKGKTNVKLEFDSSEEEGEIKDDDGDFISRPYNGSYLSCNIKDNAVDKDSHGKHNSNHSENIHHFTPQWTEGSVYSRQLLKITYPESPLGSSTSNVDNQREFSSSPPWLHQKRDRNSNSDNIEVERVKDLSFSFDVSLAASCNRSLEVNAYSQVDKWPFKSPRVTPPCTNKNLQRHLSWGSVRDKSTSLADISPYLASVTSPSTSTISRKLTSRFKLPQYNINGLMSFEPGVDIIDTHCHLDFLFRRIGFKGTYSQYQLVNKDTYPVCYGGCITDFCDPSTFGLPILWKDLLEEDKIWATFGCHPHMAEQYNPEIEMHLIDALQHDKVVALGEVGLDYSPKNSCARKIQHHVLRKQLKIAVAHNVPIVIHCRDAHEDCLKILKEEVPCDHFIHRHCFTGNWDEAILWLETFPNLYIGLTALVTFPAATDVHEVARKVPLNRLLLETDTPYFLPRLDDFH
ncbi:uncharacterized protein LOC106469189 isoform X2 [Limulus polyphemus]|uniref:Uncharacterized protein LOC106469189 isoform X2 n=1 Tax=Limulus polyphemus TaxID=6850 RepID=A0ABM1TE19_LIMPO|nr:uncharacterized protein LOC106469189 isoform X2 [Limulus polyphemus]